MKVSPCLDTGSAEVSSQCRKSYVDSVCQHECVRCPCRLAWQDAGERCLFLHCCFHLRVPHLKVLPAATCLIAAHHASSCAQSTRGTCVGCCPANKLAPLPATPMVSSLSCATPPWCVQHNRSYDVLRLEGARRLNKQVGGGSTASNDHWVVIGSLTSNPKSCASQFTCNARNCRKAGVQLKVRHNAL